MHYTCFKFNQNTRNKDAVKTKCCYFTSLQTEQMPLTITLACFQKAALKVISLQESSVTLLELQGYNLENEINPLLIPCGIRA